jgi:alkanesulfonate monooxygenase SsuD/methylene tetrahydromethanopterin reductase-like flavin-dependent oxidoreductase (luciferase family)
MTTIGAVFRPQVAPERLRDAARAADDAGLEQLWVWEDCFFQSGIASAGAALGWTERVRVGVGLLPVPLRNVALATMEAATLHRMFGDRVILGVGHGVQSWMGQTGARVESPMTLLREHLTAMRALLRGERVTTDGRYVKLDDIALEWPPTTPPALFVGAGGPRTTRLAGELADGSILTATSTPDSVREARRLIDEGRARGGRTDDHEVVLNLNAATGPGAAERLNAELERQGDTFGAAGDAAAIAAAVQEMAEAGADTVILQPTSDDPDPIGFIRFVAEEVRPLVG